MAKYEALSKGLDLAREINAMKLCVHNDSLLVIGQVRGQFKAKEEKMAKY